MSMDSNLPLSRVNVQANNNDTIWNGAGYGAGAGLGAMGLTYGATVHGARALDELNFKVAGNKATRAMTRNSKRMEQGKSHFTPLGLEQKIEGIHNRSYRVANALGAPQHVGSAMFGSKKRMLGTMATGLMGGMLIGAGIDHNK